MNAATGQNLEDEPDTCPEDDISSDNTPRSAPSSRARTPTDPYYSKRVSDADETHPFLCHLRTLLVVRRRVTHRRVTTKRKKKISAAASRNSPAALAGKSPFAQASEPLVVDPPAPAAAEITAALTSPSVAAALLGSGPKAVGFPKLLSPLNPATQEVAAETSARDSWGLGGPADRRATASLKVSTPAVANTSVAATTPPVEEAPLTPADETVKEAGGTVSASNLTSAVTVPNPVAGASAFFPFPVLAGRATS
ncbi:hypothetical protein K443DRAFT_3241 [Laccaria amethystina LaAM-08-1]|uniref:Uncharacterized protein n=1 Tax=Laccaria amethystina LaAM-08-1 TaxID=1095629 RepID=A0A0C9X226_9AGAR|nr:hypothetical protein K443DRAFT_3241 [Laccaria amethystina LaAM-08-1]